jgi:CDP-paratose 2-epimerase
MKWLVTGGVGFIGTNVCGQLVQNGHEVHIVDDLSRAGVKANAEFLATHYGLRPEILDVSDQDTFWSFLTSQGPFDAVAHLAGQVSLLESLKNPRRDFEINAIGTINLLEYVRRCSPETAVVALSSNKVYGDLSHIEIVETESRYSAPAWPKGFDESLPIDLHGPYGCSKGVADQYLADYARSFGLRTASLRQSSVFGPHQHPRADQGWVAHLITEAVAGRQIELNGVGKQVRDLLHVHDLARLIDMLGSSLVAGEVNQFNIGGGTSNALSILELFTWLKNSLNRNVAYVTGRERPNDQKVFVADTSRVEVKCGWKPTIDIASGLEDLLESVHRQMY